MELASSEVRKRLKHGTVDGTSNYAMIEGLVPPAVLTHIARYKLYD
jgi:hypothetical protein